MTGNGTASLSPAGRAAGFTAGSGRPPGSAARLRRITPAKLATLDPTALAEFRHLLKTFVVGELRKQVSWLDASGS